MTISAVSRQLSQHERLQRRLSEPWAKLVVLERLARGGSATNWFFAETRPGVQSIFDRLHPGSSVSFYFADQIRIGRSSPELRNELEQLVRTTGEVIVGTRSGRDPAIEMIIISGPGELEEHLSAVTEADIFWGTWPGRDGDGTDAVTLALVDSDGVHRSHPY